MEKLDPHNTFWAPTNCKEAVTLFYRKRELGQIEWDNVDRTFRELARALPEDEFNKFYNWIINPSLAQTKHLEEDPLPTSGYIGQTEIEDEKKDESD